jgi:AcrR family transcriptional regulator
VAARAGVSESVFHDVFPTVADCYQATFDEGLTRLSRTVDQAAGGQSVWLDRLRAGLVAFLGFLDDEPAWGRLLISEAPIANRAVGLRCEQRILGVLTSVLDDGTPQTTGSSELLLASEFVVGGAVSVIRAQMLKGERTALVSLAPSLMSFIIRPYLGPVAANTELEGRPSPRDCQTDRPMPSRETRLARTAELPIRVTHRTTMVLHAIAQTPYSNNREIADAAGLTDEGQTSKLLARLERQGVIENVGIGPARGEPNAWLLTPSGQRTLALISASATPQPRSARLRGEG